MYLFIYLFIYLFLFIFIYLSLTATTNSLLVRELWRQGPQLNNSQTLLAS